MSIFNLLPVVVNSRFVDVLIVSPSICQPELPVDQVVTCTKPIPHIDALYSEVVLQVVGVLYVLEVQHYLGVLLWRSWEIVLVKEGVESSWVLDLGVRMVRSLTSVFVNLVH